MIRASSWTVAAIAAAVLTYGCHNPDDDEAPGPKPLATSSFEGKVDPQYVGSWKSQDGITTMKLDKDGSASIGTDVTSRSGKSSTVTKGKWLASGKNLMIEYSDTSGKETVLKYEATLSGKNLTLAQAGGRLRTQYTRQ